VSEFSLDQFWNHETEVVGLNLSGMQNIAASEVVVRLPYQPLEPNLGEAFSEIWSFYDGIEDAFFYLMSGETIEVNVEDLLAVAIINRRVDAVCVEKETGRYVASAGGLDPNCEMQLGASTAILYPDDWAASRFAREFLSEKVVLSIFFFPPVLASALAIWLVCAGSLGNFVSSRFADLGLVTKFVSNNPALSMVVAASFLTAISSFI
jgi:hypothetical protein